jgi:adenosine deaminase
MESENIFIKDLKKFCINLPKIELHAHLNGSIRKETLLELLSEEDRQQALKIYSDQMSFNNAFKMFSISSKIITSLDIIRRITREMIEDWNWHNCIYLEIRTSIKKIGNCSKEDYLRAVLEEIYKGNQKYQMKTRLIISLNRELDIEDYLETFLIFKNFKNSESDGELKQLIVGVDYSGNAMKEKHKYSEIIPIMENFKNEGLKVTIHLGEIINYEKFDFNKCSTNFLPDRVSHTFFYTEEECEEIIKNNVPIEICPSSSYYCKDLNDFKEIPFKFYYKKKNCENREISDSNDSEINMQLNSIIPENCKFYNLFSIGTDDTMLFDTDLSEEYFLIFSNFNFSVNEIKEILLKNVEFIFETDSQVRTELKDIIINHFNTLYKKDF